LCSIPDDSERISRVINGASTQMRSRPVLEPRAATTNTPISGASASSPPPGLVDADPIERVSQDVILTVVQDEGVEILG